MNKDMHMKSTHFTTPISSGCGHVHMVTRHCRQLHCGVQVVRAAPSCYHYSNALINNGYALGTKSYLRNLRFIQFICCEYYSNLTDSHAQHWCTAIITNFFLQEKNKTNETFWWGETVLCIFIKQRIDETLILAKKKKKKKIIGYMPMLFPNSITRISIYEYPSFQTVHYSSIQHLN